MAYKLKAGLVSFSIFLCFAGVLAFLSYSFWYPEYLFWTDGGVQGLKLICAVDFILGPVLALVFFHPEKSRGKLVFDIAVIAIIQLGAMVWGACQVYGQRPIAVVYGSHRFISVAPAIMALQRKNPDFFLYFSPDRPPYVYRREPLNQKERQLQLAMLWQHGFHFEAQAWLFQPFRHNLAKVFERQAGVREYLSKTMADAWRGWVDGRKEQDMASYRFAFYEGRYANALLVFSPLGQYQGYLPMGTAPLPDIKDLPLSR